MHGRNGRNGRNGFYGNGSGWGSFNLATVFQVLVVPVVILTGFYYVTNYRLSEIDLAIHDTFPKEIRTEAEAREKSRNEFLDKLGKLNESIGALNTNLAVQGEILNSIKNEIHGANARGK